MPYNSITDPAKQPLNPQGVDHGPYLQAEDDPWGQVDGHMTAIEDAFMSGEITPPQAAKLMENIGQLAVQAQLKEAAAGKSLSLYRDDTEQ